MGPKAVPADNPAAEENEPNYNLLALHGSAELSEGQTGQQCRPQHNSTADAAGFQPPTTGQGRGTG